MAQQPPAIQACLLTGCTTRRFDNNSTLDQQAVAATAALLARTLHTLGMTGQGASSLSVNTTALTTVVAGLSACLAQNSPGLSCSLASQLMVAGYSSQDGVVSYAPQHYVGVVRVWAADPQDPSYKSDVSRCVWTLVPAVPPCCAGVSMQTVMCGEVRHVLPPKCVEVRIVLLPSVVRSGMCCFQV
jgi:hypothetical protein